jgi:hypothetical protein
MGILFGAVLLLVAPVFAQAPESNVAQAQAKQTTDVARTTEEMPATPEPITVMRDYRGVRLGMTTEEVRAVMGDPARKDQTWDEFKLSKGDLMTVHYDNGMVKAVQLYFTDADRAPEFVEVVGDIELTMKDNGARFARRVVQGEKFWVSMYQSGDKEITTVSFGQTP